MDTKKSLFPIWATAAFSWFGYHCGSGFASGTQVKAYVIRYGAKGIFAVFMAWICCAAFIWIISEYARLVKAKSYRDVATTIYWPNEALGRVVILVWDIMVLLSCIVASSSCMAGAGALLQNLVGAPYWVGCAIFVAVMVFLLCFGEGALNRLGNISSIMIFLVLAICLAGLVSKGGNLGSVMASYAGEGDTAGAGLGKILNSGFTYGCIQISFLHTTCVLGGKMDKRSTVNKYILLGFLMNCGVMFVEALTIFGYVPEGVMESNMPMLFIVQSFKGAFGLLLLVIYNFVLIMAYVTTAGAVITGQIARYRGLIGKVIKNDFWCKAAIVIFFLLCSSVVATLGLEGVVTKAYGFLSNLRKPLWFFPLIILGPISIMRVMKQQKENPEAPAEA